MLMTPWVRLPVASLIAAPLVYILFTLASWLVDVREVRLQPVEPRLLTSIVPETSDPWQPRLRSRPERLDAAPKPPPPPRQSHTRDTVIVPEGDYSGGMPETLDPQPIRFETPSASPIASRRLTPVRAPVPVMPDAAQRLGVSGTCDVTFDVDERGRPFNVVAQCSHQLFRNEAERAVRRAEFLPAIRDGRPVMQTGAVYPLEFRVN